MNCAVGQGFLFGFPAPLSVANSLVTEQNIAPAKPSFVRIGSLSPQFG
jgi:hypothetical protein